jgi:hypothetical protein
MGALRDDLAREADAKAIVAAKLMTDAVEARHRLMRSVGLEPDAAYRPLLDEARRADATRSAVQGALGLVDPPGVARQMQLAVLGRARRSGGSLLGRVVGLLGLLTGQSRRTADPPAYLRDWRRRGSIGRVMNPVHAALVEASTSVPAGSRRAVLAALRTDQLEPGLSGALESAARDATGDLRIPRSILWPVVGAVQLAIGAVFAFAVVWYVTLFLAPGQVPVSTVDVPVLGPLPLPLILLAGSIVMSGLLGLLLALHAGWIGRRAGARIAERVRTAVGSAVTETGFGGLDRVEMARRRMG